MTSYITPKQCYRFSAVLYLLTEVPLTRIGILCLYHSEYRRWLHCTRDFPNSSVGKESPCNAGDPSSIPGPGRSAGEGLGNPLQYPSLENSMDYIVHGVAKSRTCQQLSLYFISMVQTRIFFVETEISPHTPPHPHLCPTCASFGFFSTGSDEAVVDTSRRVGGALARKSALRNRLNDAIKRLQAAERGEDLKQNLSSSVCSLILR